MATTTARNALSRNGFRHGDVSYVTLGTPQIERARSFYAAVLGWTYSPGSDPERGSQVDHILPMTGLWSGPQPVGPQIHGAVLGFRVDDISAAITAVRNAGGTATEPHREPYGLTAEGTDDQGMPFYLHEMPTATGDPVPQNGVEEGDLSYITIAGTDIDRTRAFFAAVLGWTYNIGRLGGAQVNHTVPQIGLGSADHAPTVVLGYRVNDIAATVTRIRAAGGKADSPQERPYGLESHGYDDQGTEFYLHQLPA